MRFPQRLGTSKWAVAALLACLVLPATTGHAQFVTQNAFVGGLVDGSTGHVTWTKVVNGKARPVDGAKPLTFQGFSYLTLRIDNLYYTNNDAGTTPTLVANSFGTFPLTHTPDVALNNGTTSKIQDTIETTWHEQSGAFDIVQDVYPVQFRNSGQVVLKVKIVNHSTSALSVNAQYLNDVLSGANDYAFMLEQFGYEGNLTVKAYNSSPPNFYMGFEGDPSTLGLGIIGAGYTSDAFAPAPMGLTPCTAMEFGNDPILATYTWGGPGNSTSSSKFDVGTILQWPGMSAQPNNGSDVTTEIFRTSYGTEEFCICYGNVIAIGLHPTHLTWNKASRTYSPNPFNVEEIIVNTGGSALSNVHVTQSVSGPLRIIGGPIGIGPSSISAGNAGDYTWTDSTALDTGCNGIPGVFDLTIDVSASGLPPGSLTCNDNMCSVTVDCADVDNVAPIVDNFRRVTNPAVFLDTAFNVHDSSSHDFGMQSIAWSQVSGPPANFVVTPPVQIPPITNGGYLGCSRSVYTIDVKQKDSVFGGCIGFTFTDCYGNVSRDTICFNDHTPIVHYDKWAPIFVRVGASKLNDPVHSGGGCDSTTNYQATQWTVIDTLNQPYAHGLKSVDSISGSNMTFKRTAFANAADSAHFQIAVVDTFKDGSICIQATDTAGNSDTLCLTYCTVPDTIAPVITGKLIPAYTEHIHVTDRGPWQRGLDQVYLINAQNVVTNPSPIPNPLLCVDTFDFDVNVLDQFKGAGFRVVAVDCKGNRDTSAQFSLGGLVDKNPPILKATPITPDSMLITITDFTDSAADQGIDSVWFTGVSNMHFQPIDPTLPGAQTVPPLPAATGTFATIHGTPSGLPTGHPLFQRSVSFTVSIADTNNVPYSPASMTICAVDGASLTLVGGCWSWTFPMQPDSLPPLIVGSNPTCKSVDINVSDNRARDRGIAEFKLTNAINFQPFDNRTLAGSHNLTLNVITPGKSAYGKLWAVDTFGAKNPTFQSAHTAASDVWIYAQDLHMKAAKVVLQDGDFAVPIMLDTLDPIHPPQKNLTQLQFSFHLTGSNLINFVSVAKGSYATGWTATATPNGSAANRDYTITASGPALLDWGAKEDTVLVLTFHGTASPTTDETVIQIDPNPNTCDSIVYPLSYNGGTPVPIPGGQNSTITVPAPFGNLNGGTLTLKGACSPFISENGAPPTAISLAPITPNPASLGSSSLRIDYTIPAEGPVTLNLYNGLGVQVRTIVAETQKQGEYWLDIPAGNLPQGIYFFRLESGGESRMRRVILGE